jgi:hypothetical protein
MTKQCTAELVLRRCARLGFRPEPEVAEWAAEEIDRLRAEIARIKRTVAFQEKTYLEQHGGSWGKCKYQAEADELREVLELLMMDEWGYRETEAPDVQDVLVERGILVERPAPQSFRDEWDADTWFVFRWSTDEEERP